MKALERTRELAGSLPLRLMLDTSLVSLTPGFAITGWQCGVTHGKSRSLCEPETSAMP